MQEQTLYTFGYLSGRAERIITELIAVKTPVVDVRFSPTSTKYAYTQEILRHRDNIIYYHIPDLGNEWYKEARKTSGPYIQLHAQETGLAALKEILDAYGRAAIFCACNNKTTCHRMLVARLAHEQFGVKVIHL